VKRTHRALAVASTARYDGGRHAFLAAAAAKTAAATPGCGGDGREERA
jgi:hypothetical protein